MKFSARSSLAVRSEGGGVGRGAFQREFGYILYQTELRQAWWHVAKTASLNCSRHATWTYQLAMMCCDAVGSQTQFRLHVAYSSSWVRIFLFKPH